MSERNRARFVEMVERVVNGHDVEAIAEYTRTDHVAASFRSVLTSFPDVQVDIVWTMADGDRVAAFQTQRGTQTGPWLFGIEPTGRPTETSILVVLEFDEDGMATDYWLCTNFLSVLEQLGGGIVRPGETA